MTSGCKIRKFAHAEHIDDVHKLLKFRAGKKVAEGGFNTIYEVMVPSQEIVSAGVTIPNYHILHQQPNALLRIGQFAAHDAKKVQTEINLLWRLGRQGISPRIMNIFWDCHNDEYRLAVIMERWGASLETYFNTEYWERESANIAARLSNLLKRLAEEQVLCVDVKPGNVVVRHTGSKISDMRLIDFGGDFCFEKKTDSRLNYAMMLILMQGYTHRRWPNELGNFLLPYIKPLLADAQIRKELLRRAVDEEDPMLERWEWTTGDATRGLKSDRPFLEYVQGDPSLKNFIEQVALQPLPQRNTRSFASSTSSQDEIFTRTPESSPDEILTSKIASAIPSRESHVSRFSRFSHFSRQTRRSQRQSRRNQRLQRALLSRQSQQRLTRYTNLNRMKLVG